MFLKIVRKTIGVEELYECDTLRTVRMSRDDKHQTQFQLTNNKENPECIKLVNLDFPDPAIIYTMSSTGKTIDTMEYRGRGEVTR